MSRHSAGSSSAARSCDFPVSGAATNRLQIEGRSLGEIEPDCGACFADPYQERYEQARASLGSSWIDGGINSLSIISRFADPLERESLRRIGGERASVFEARVSCRAGERDLTALILTSWHVTDSAKTTRITFQSGARLVLDHTAVAGYLITDGRVAEVYGSDRSIPRRDRHYLALYDWWLTGGSPVLPAPASLRLHEGR